MSKRHQGELKRLLGELEKETRYFEELTSNEKLKEVKEVKGELAKYLKQLKRERDTEAETLADRLMREEKGSNAFQLFLDKQHVKEKKKMHVFN